VLKIGGKLLMPNHHPNCPRYNDSLIDVWKVTLGGVTAYNLNEQDARDCVGDSEMVVEQVKMHREVFEQLPEFEGF
jgi:hypothetical protein